ncbi:MAG: 3-deoxy-D-manno-octulosonic acid transferase [Gemmatimonadales bacterium]
MSRAACSPAPGRRRSGGRSSTRSIAPRPGSRPGHRRVLPSSPDSSVRRSRTGPFYQTLIRLGIALAPLASARRPKIREGLAGREGLLERLSGWARTRRDLTRRLLWLHATSVGEGRQAEAVLRVLRSAHPDWQVAFTFFSPSAAGLAGELGAEVADYLPWDRRRDVEAALDLLRPTALVFAKLDLWPELATRAAARGVAVGLIAATVSPRARRLRWPARALLAPGYRAVRLAGAITRGDALRLTRLGVLAHRIEVVGDPRYDSVLDRARAIAPDDPLRRYGRGGPTLVAGSTWPEDEAVLLPAYASVRRIWPVARLIVVPHEPTPRHLVRLDQAAQQAGLPNPQRLSAAPPPGETPFLVVDRVGVLPACYADAAIAYVGGGFGTGGLHSVLEPAGAGHPVLFGPAWQGSPDAGVLLEARAAAVVGTAFPDWLDLDTGATLVDAHPLAALWLALLRHPGPAREAGRRGRAVVVAGAGAAARNAVIVERLMLGAGE